MHPLLKRTIKRAIAPFLPQTFEQQIYRRVIERGDVCFDIGANVGEVTDLMARLVGPRGVVVAFEPVWPTYRRLCRRARDTGGDAEIVTVPLGLGDSHTVATMHVPGSEFALGSLAPASTWSATHHNRKIASYECQVSTVDWFLKASGLPSPQFIKIDVEGAELLTLRGSQALLQSDRPPLMLIELFAPWQKAFGYGPAEVLSFLRKNNMKVLFVCPQGLIAHDASDERPLPPEYEKGDYIIAYRESAHRDRIARLADLRIGGKGKPGRIPPPPRPNRIEV